MVVMLWAILWLSSCSVEEVPLQACTDLGCTDGYEVGFEPPLSGYGAWVIQVTDQDGTVATCSYHIPFNEDPTDGCDNPDMLSASISGTQLDPVDQELPSVFSPAVPETWAIVVTRDGVEVAAADLAPVAEVHMPNGEDCPPVCESAADIVAVSL